MRDEEDPGNGPTVVSNALCRARMETLEEKIKGLKTAIYASAATVTLIVTAVEIALKFTGH